MEIGCGNGYLARKLARAGAKVIAIDNSETFISIAREKERNQRFGIRYLHRDAIHLKGLASKKFDIVLSNMVLMDIRHFGKAIKEASRVLKRGGQFVFSIVHPIYSDWQHAVAEYKGKKYYARILKKYLSQTDDDRMHWKSGHATTHYHRPIQSYIHALREAGLIVMDFHEIRTSRRLTKAPTSEKEIMDRLTRYYVTRKDKMLKHRTRKEIPLFLIVGTVKT